MDTEARLDPTVVVATQLYGLTSAVRALIATHPEPDRLRQVFDQLLGQMLAHPGMVLNPEQGIVLREMAEVLFRSPVALDR